VNSILLQGMVREDRDEKDGRLEVAELIKIRVLPHTEAHGDKEARMRNGAPTYRYTRVRIARGAGWGVGGGGVGGRTAGGGFRVMESLRVGGTQSR
jgi:hypothetical protein